MSRSCRSLLPGDTNSANASAICARPASISASVAEANQPENARGTSGVGPDGTQSNSSADGLGARDGGARG